MKWKKHITAYRALPCKLQKQINRNYHSDSERTYMRKRHWLRKILFTCLLLLVGFTVGIWNTRFTESDGQISLETAKSTTDTIFDSIHGLLGGEPSEVKALRSQELVQIEEGHQEYYFNLLETEEDRRTYRQLLDGVREREEFFYVTMKDAETVDRIYHAVLKDHPEIYWVHNRNDVYKTMYPSENYCLFTPGYSYTQAQMKEIDAALETAYQEALSLVPEGAGDYEKVMTVYTYLIDQVDYVASEDDQSIAGAFWKKEAVCAGYAGGMQYLLERMGIPCIYVDGSAAGSDEGHAWNIVQIDGEYYYADATNGDQPEFLEGDAVQLAEHKTTIYDYLCPFPEEYELTYTPSDEFVVPECTAKANNFYVRNQACFDVYDWDSVYALCRLRIDNNAAVIRFRFSNAEAFDQAYDDCVVREKMQEVARYYMDTHGMDRVSYHYGILDDFNTMYYMF